MTSIVRVSPRLTGKEEIVIVPLFKGERQFKGLTKKLDVLSRSALTDAIKNRRFEGKSSEVFFTSLQQPKAPRHALLVGLGDAKKFDAESAASAGGTAARVVKKHRFKTAHLVLHGWAEEESRQPLVQSFLKGFLLGQYEFAIKAKSDPGTAARKLSLLADPSRALGEAIRRAQIIAEHTVIVRDLVNTPANILTPAALADRAKALAKESAIQCNVMGLREIERLKMGAVISVGKGSRREPRFITLHYNKGARGVRRVCLVGKGVTFDTGGISIKPWQNMNEMKGDMAGAALVISTMAAAARMKVPVEIIGLIPCVENMPDGDSFRPGDIITTYSGKTIEILSTDAEGRLILSDALARATEFHPDVIVDFATLTGAVVIALGTRIAGAMGNNAEYMDRLLRAGKAAGEPVWQLPLDDYFSDAVKGDISDYKNYSGRDGSSITAAALLGEFVGKTPWIHVDIAGTFWSESGAIPYHAKGATGYGVDLAVRFLELVAAEG
jgi:leucyl aminopeptidase